MDYLVVSSLTPIRVVDRYTLAYKTPIGIDIEDVDAAIEDAGWCGIANDDARVAIVAVGADTDALQQAVAFVVGAL